MDDEYYKILGVKIPHIIIPVRPGRDLARLVEVAAMHIKLKAAGYNTARELDERVIKKAQSSNNRL
jgi:HPr kinase/phosphorylase